MPSTLLLISSRAPFRPLLATAIEPHAVIEDLIVFHLEIRLILIIALGVGHHTSTYECMLPLSSCFKETSTTASISKSTGWRRVSRYGNELVFGRRVGSWYMEHEVLV